MRPEVQTLISLALVAVAALWLVHRTLAKRKHPGCGGDCGCPTDGLKAKLRR